MYNYNYSAGSAAGGGAAAAFLGAFFFIYFLVVLAIVVLVIAGLWKVFTKAGQPGWAAIIPIYNVYILLQVVGRPVWWLAFLLLPIIPVIGSLALLVVVVHPVLGPRQVFRQGRRVRHRVDSPRLHLRADPRIWVGAVPRPDGKWVRTA